MEVKNLVSATRKFVDDLEQYRQPWESKGHWNARKTFLRYHWKNYEDKQRLICLSSAWANVRFMENRFEFALARLYTLAKVFCARVLPCNCGVSYSIPLSSYLELCGVVLVDKGC